MMRYQILHACVLALGSLGVIGCYVPVDAHGTNSFIRDSHFQEDHDKNLSARAALPMDDERRGRLDQLLRQRKPLGSKRPQSPKRQAQWDNLSFKINNVMMEHLDQEGKEKSKPTLQKHNPEFFSWRKPEAGPSNVWPEIPEHEASMPSPPKPGPMKLGTLKASTSKPGGATHEQSQQAQEIEPLLQQHQQPQQSQEITKARLGTPVQSYRESDKPSPKKKSRTPKKKAQKKDQASTSQPSSRIQSLNIEHLDRLESQDHQSKIGQEKPKAQTICDKFQRGCRKVYTALKKNPHTLANAVVTGGAAVAAANAGLQSNTAKAAAAISCVGALCGVGLDLRKGLKKVEKEEEAVKEKTAGPEKKKARRDLDGVLDQFLVRRRRGYGSDNTKALLLQRAMLFGLQS